MQLLKSCLAAPLVAVSLSWPAMAQDIARGEVSTVMANCERQRETMIAPLRDEAIRYCVEVQGLDQRACERRNRNYGERGFGDTPQGVGWDLPDCQRAEGAQDHFEQNPDSDRYAY